MKALVVEDAPEMVDTIALCLTIRWPDTKLLSTGSGSNAVALLEAEAPDVVFLDLGLPDVDGLAVLQDIRKFSEVPVIVITARGEETARVKGLEMGADDYVVKPFSHTELLARVKAVLRRTYMPELWGDGGLIRGPGFVIDLAGHRVWREEQEVHLTSTEWKLLCCLVRNEGRVMSSQVLAQKVWGTEFITDSAIKMCVRRLRLKLGDDPRNPKMVHSHRGVGYSFSVPR